MGKKSDRLRLIAALTVAALAWAIGPATVRADTVITDDLIVNPGQVCVGDACADGETFPTRRLIKMRDVFGGMRFMHIGDPPDTNDNDWQIEINEGAKDGAEYFMIRDCGANPSDAIEDCGGTAVFRIDAGSPANAIRVNSNGDTGFGTAAPLAGTGIHVVKSGFVIPTFESSSGNAVQFRLRSDSPTNRRVVGITNAGVVKSQLRLDDGAVILQGEKDSNRFALFNASGLVIAGATCQTSGGGAGCDAVFDPAYGLESIEEHAAAMWGKRHLPAVGPTPEGKPISFNVHQRHFGVLNELEKAHIYIEQLDERIKSKDRELLELRESMRELERRAAQVDALDARLASLEASLQVIR